jgi:hypothetical protein
MHTAALLYWLRTDAYIGDASAYPDQTDIALLPELTHKLHTVFEDIVVKARAGYWLKEDTLITISGRGRYRIPPRSVVGGLEKIEVAPNGVYYALKEVSPEDMSSWEGSISAGNPGNPAVFIAMGDQIEMFPTPNAVFPIRMTYYIRPSQLTASQNNQFVDGQSGGTDRGRITAITNTPTDKRLWVNAVPFDMAIASPAAMTTQSIDVVHPDGWHELALVNVTQTPDTGNFILPNNTDLSDVQIGDYVRVADQTDWPCIPDDFHRCLADVAAIKVAVELGLREKGDDLAMNVENDLVRFRSLLLPRVKSEPKETPIDLKTRGGGGSSRWL